MMDTQGLRICSRCKHGKPDSEFYNKKKSRCKPCSVIEATEYNRTHPEKRKKTIDAYYQRHKDKILSAQAEYLARPEVKSSKQIGQVKYRLDNHEARLEYGAAWRAKNPEKARAAYIRGAHIRRARLKGVKVDPFSRDEVFERDAGRCRYCQITLDPSDWHLDHDIPIARGGPHILSNAVASCGPCNTRKHTMTGSEFMAKREIARPQEPWADTSYPVALSAVGSQS